MTNCHQLKMQASDGKMRLTDSADTEQVLRLIQSISYKKAEPFKMWLAKVGNERIDETVDPEQSIERAIQNYRRLGYSENWINQRIKSIEVRKAPTDEWDNKKHKDLKKENLRDNTANTELVPKMLAEFAVTDISIAKQPSGFAESAAVANCYSEILSLS